MINPINISTSPIYYSKMPAKQTQGVNTTPPSLELSDYKTGQAILARNNISFRNLSTPIEVTDKYNKKVEGKDHLDLPNVHIYEYPDTNLQLMIDENPNMQHCLNSIELRFSLKDTKEEKSYLKKAICTNLLNRQLNKQLNNAKAVANNQGGFTIIYSGSIANISDIKKINQIINKPAFTKEDLESEKQALVLEEYSNESNLLLPEDRFFSQEEMINTIKNLDIDEINEYYQEKKQSLEAKYYITVDKNIFDPKTKVQLLNILNTAHNEKYKKNDNSKYQKLCLLNSGRMKLIKDKNIENIELHYPFEENNLKDYYTSLFANFLLIFLTCPYYQENSDLNYAEPSINLKQGDFSYAFHNLNFYLPKPGYTKLLPERVVNIHKELAKMVCDTDITPTLDDIKQVFKEKLNDEINNKYEKNKNNMNLCVYDYDIFSLYEIIDSIGTDDIKTHIKKYIVEQEPIVKYKEKTNEN